MADEYISREAFLANRRKLYCADCARRKGVKNGKFKTLYEIGDAPCRSCGINDVLEDVEDYPAADVAPVVHAHWERDDKIRCSNCGMPTTDLRLEPSVVDYDQATFAVNVFAHPYCGYCGAKMDERSEDNGCF